MSASLRARCPRDSKRCYPEILAFTCIPLASGYGARGAGDFGRAHVLTYRVYAAQDSILDVLCCRALPSILRIQNYTLNVGMSSRLDVPISEQNIQLRAVNSKMSTRLTVACLVRPCERCGSVRHAPNDHPW